MHSIPIILRFKKNCFKLIAEQNIAIKRLFTAFNKGIENAQIIRTCYFYYYLQYTLYTVTAL